MATELLQEMKDATAKFFELPLEEKNKIRMSGGREGYGQAYAISEGQTMDWSDTLILSLYPAQSRDLKFWPTAPNGFRYVSKLNYSGKLFPVTFLFWVDLFPGT